MNVLAVGVTGGIGSGKSTVCAIFELLDVPVYYADQRGKELMTSDKALKSEIIKLFGQKAYFKNGRLNRKYISGIVFQNKVKLSQLNQLVHPAVARDSKRWMEKQLNHPYLLKEAALLVESGSYQSLDKLICVTAPEEIRIQRVMARDKVQKENVLSRIRQQMPESEKVKLADFIIQNDGKHSLLKQVLDIHQKLLALSKKKKQSS